MDDKGSISARLRGRWRLARADAKALGIGVGVQFAIVDLINSIGPHLPVPRRPAPIPVRLWGHTVRLRAYSSDLNVARQVFTDDEYGLIPDLAPDPLIIDCGANIGLSALHFLRRFPTAQIVCVEPDPANFDLCRRNLAPWGDQVRLIESAVWSSNANLAIDAGGRGREWASQVRVCAPGERADMSALTIGELLAQSGRTRIDLLKVDIEGAERDVFSTNTADWLPAVRNLAIELHGVEADRVVTAALDSSTGARLQRGDLTVFLGIQTDERAASAEGPSMSVVVNTYRRPQMLMRVIAAAIAQLRADDEMLVIDDGSDDDTLQVLAGIEDPRLRVVTQPNQGLAAARNRGAREARHPIVIFLDDDTIPHHGLVEAHRRAQASSGNRAVMGRPVLVVPHRRGKRRIMPGDRTPDMLVTDASLSIRTSALLQVHGYDEAMRGWEDIDLGIRLEDAGVELAVAPTALVDHDIDRPYKSFRRQRVERGTARALGIRRHGRERARAYLPRHPADRALLALAIRSKWFAEAAPVVLWVVVRAAGRLGSWKVQSLAASRAGMIISLRAETLELRRATRPAEGAP